MSDGQCRMIGRLWVQHGHAVGQLWAQHGRTVVGAVRLAEYEHGMIGRAQRGWPVVGTVWPADCRRSAVTRSADCGRSAIGWL